MDVVTTRIVIAILGVLCLICLGGSIALAVLHIEIPQILVATIASASGAIVGILAPNKGRDDPPPAAVK